jgi:hypothetical protein
MCAFIFFMIWGIATVLVLIFMIFGILEVDMLNIFITDIKPTYLLMSILPFIIVLISMIILFVWIPLGCCRLSGLIINVIFFCVTLGLGIWIAVQFHSIEFDLYGKEIINKLDIFDNLIINKFPSLETL